MENLFEKLPHSAITRVANEHNVSKSYVANIAKAPRTKTVTQAKVLKSLEAEAAAHQEELQNIANNPVNA